jgi:two-component system sensor histidine kinase VicK
MNNSINQPEYTGHVVASSEARLSAILTASPSIIYRMSADWQIFQQLDGEKSLVDLAEPVTDWQSRFIHPDDLEGVNAAIRQATLLKQKLQLEHRVLRTDGTTGWTFSRAVPVINEQGDIVEWIGTANNVTDRKNAEIAEQAAVTESDKLKRLYEAITSGTPDLMYVFDLEYRFTYANAALLTMWGKTWENSVGKSLLENGYEPWHAQMHEREIDQVRATGLPIQGVVEFPHATLGIRSYEYIFTPVFDESGMVEAVAGTTRDITQRKHNEQSLAISAAQLQSMNEEMATLVEEERASNEELLASNEQLTDLNQQLLAARTKIEEGEVALRLAISAANFGTWFIHSVTREFVTDARLKELFGYHPDEELSIEQALAQITEEYREEVTKKLHDAIYHNGDYDVTYPVIGLHDNRLRWLRAIGNLKADPSGSFSAFTGVVMDITEQKTDEIRKNDFIGMVSHELKTPLTSMKGYIQILLQKMKFREGDFNLTVLKKTDVQVSKMVSMINGFLNMSRLESGKIQINTQHFDIALLLQESQEETLTTVSSHTFIFKTAEDVMIHADRDKIGQVIHNLISNAVKYSPVKTTIVINCHIAGESIVVSVSDQGIGIKPNDLAQIFERYYRVEDPKMSSISGFGIGLYLCAEIIERHHGKIWAESEYGKGSTFSFSLPLQ